MPRVEINCFCSESTSSIIHPKLNNISPSDWVVLPACGHIFHQRCIRSWTQFQTQKNSQCPVCRTSTKLVSITNERTKHKTRLTDVRLFFPEDPKSDADSQYVNDLEEEIVSSEDEIEENDDIVDDDGIGNQGAGAGGGENIARGGVGVEVLRVQLREMRNTLREVKQERDQLKEVETDLTIARARIAELEDTAAEQDIEQERLEEELAAVTAERDQLEEGQPDLRAVIEQLEEEVENLCATVAEKDIEIEGLRRDLKKKSLEKNEQEDERRRDKMEWANTRKQMLERINSEGSAGAERIRSMNQKMEEQESKILELRCSKDRLEFFTADKIQKNEAECKSKLDEAQMEVEAAKRSVTLAQKDAADARTKARRIERANDNWQAKYDKIKLQLQKTNSTKNRIVSPSPSPTNSQTPPTSPTKKRNYAVEFSPANSYSPEKKFRISSRLANSNGNSNNSGASSTKRSRVVNGNDDEEEDEDERTFARARAKGKAKALNQVLAVGESSDSDVIVVEPHARSSGSSGGPRIIKSRPMATIGDPRRNLNGAGVFGKKPVELGITASDKHVPDFSKGHSVGIAAKIRQRKV